MKNKINTAICGLCYRKKADEMNQWLPGTTEEMKQQISKDMMIDAQIGYCPVRWWLEDEHIDPVDFIKSKECPYYLEHTISMRK